jgi:diguanylate cyclase (GGDEF)-like protein
MLKDILNNMNFEDSKKLASRIQLVINDHFNFVMGLNKILISQKREDISEPSIFSENGHQYCEFGQWYNSFNNSVLGRNEAFIKLGSMHLEMHNIAHELINELPWKNGSRLGRYEQYIALQQVFFTELWEVINVVISSQCYFDSLTGLLNRSAFRLIISKELEKAKRNDTDNYIVMADIDNFKSVNDHYGHAIGDTVLINIAKFFMEHIRKGDTLARYGGEEFIFFVSDSTEKTVQTVMDRMRVALEHYPVPISNNLVINVTASFGVSRLVGVLEKTINNADAALYEAKAKGKNQVIFR